MKAFTCNFPLLGDLPFDMKASTCNLLMKGDLHFGMKAYTLSPDSHDTGKEGQRWRGEGRGEKKIVGKSWEGKEGQIRKVDEGGGGREDILTVDLVVTSSAIAQYLP